MSTIPATSPRAQVPGLRPALRPTPQPSADGGVLLLLSAWTLLGERAALGAGLVWQGVGAELLLFVLVALPLLGASSVRAIAVRCAAGRDPLWVALGWARVVSQRRLARFVTSPRHRWGVCLGQMVAALATHPATRLSPEGVLVVDSTTLEKRYGPRLPHRRPVYDSSQKRLVDGYEVVSACAVGPAPGAGADAPLRRWPVGLEPHQPPATPPARAALKRRRRQAQPGEAPSKLDRALGLVEQAQAQGLRVQTVLGDSAFCVQWWLRALGARGLHWLVGTRQDRRLRIGATVQPCRAWCQDLPLTLVEPHPTHSQAGVWGAQLPAATLLDKGCRVKGLACRPCYFERRDRQGRVIHRWYLVTDHLGWDLATVWSRWAWRWSIEELHRDAKQFLGLADCHGRTWTGLVAWLACASLRASLLAFLRALEPSCGAYATGACVAALSQAAVVVTPQPDHAHTVSWPCRLPAPTLRAQHDGLSQPPGWPTTLQVA